MGLGTALPPIFHVGRFTMDIQTYNSLVQSPCYVAAYLLATCNNGGNIFSNSCAPLHVFTRDSVYSASPDSGTSFIWRSHQRSQPGRMLFVQPRCIQSPECLQRLPRRGADIVRSAFRLCTAICSLISPSQSSWSEYSLNCTTILPYAT